MQRIDDGLKSVPKICFTFSSSNIPIQIVLNPTPDAASNEKAAAIVASCNENFSKICGGNFSLTL